MGGRGAQDGKSARGGRTAAGGRRRRAVRRGGRPVCLLTGKIRYRDEPGEAGGPHREEWGAAKLDDERTARLAGVIAH